jgi:hypothetical protein
VTWLYATPSALEEPLTGYMVKYWESDKDMSVANKTVVYLGNPPEATISNLTPGRTYQLRVLAFSRGGEGKMSSPAWQFQMGDPDQLSKASSLVPAVAVLAVTLATLVFQHKRQHLTQ